MKENFGQSLARVLKHEGGFVNHPADPGGATKYGVTIGTMQRLGFDLTGDGRVTEADLRKLSRPEAEKIFVEHYFHGPHVDALPQVLQPSVFDMYVNAGANAVRILQRLLGDMGQVAAVDGTIGPQTIAAAEAAYQAAPDFIADAYGIARRNYYYALAHARPASRKYARRCDGGKGGWITRAEEFISPRYRLSDAEHALRVAKWG